MECLTDDRASCEMAVSPLRRPRYECENTVEEIGVRKNLNGCQRVKVPHDIQVGSEVAIVRTDEERKGEGLESTNDARGCGCGRDKNLRASLRSRH